MSKLRGGFSTGACAAAGERAPVLVPGKTGRSAAERRFTLRPGQAVEVSNERAHMPGQAGGRGFEALPPAGRRAVAVRVAGEAARSAQAKRECGRVPGISSAPVAFARLGLNWTGAEILRAHSARPQAAVAGGSVVAPLAGARSRSAGMRSCWRGAARGTPPWSART